MQDGVGRPKIYKQPLTDRRAQEIVDDRLSRQPTITFLNCAIITILSGTACFLIVIFGFMPKHVAQTYGLMVMSVVALIGAWLLHTKQYQANRPRATLIELVLLGLLLAATVECRAEMVQAFSTATGAQPPAPWQVHGFPGRDKPVSQFDVVSLNGERMLRVTASKSYGTLRHELAAIHIGPGSTLHWRWRLDQPLRDADLRRKSGDDSPLKLCALFDLPTDKLGLFDRTLLFAARSISKEYVPAATLCYVWDHRLSAGTELPNAFTQRVRYVVLNSGDHQLGTWIPHERDLATDFMRVFGNETDTVPPLIALLVGADADNTAGHSLAYVGDLTLKLVPQTVKK